MIEPLLCPYCSNTPQILDEGNSCTIMCGRYTCNLYFAVVGNTKEHAITFWNDEITKIKEAKNDQQQSGSIDAK